MRSSATNSLLPLYKDPRERVRADHDGFGLSAHGRFLMPFSIQDDRVTRFQLASDDGQVYTLDVSLLTALDDADGNTFYVYNGGDIGAEYCGLHSVILTGISNNYYSAWMYLHSACDDQRAGIASVATAIVVGGVDYAFTFADNVAGLENAGNVLIDGTDRVPFTGTAATASGTEVVVVRTVKGRCGTFVSTYAASTAGGGTLTLIDQSSRPNDELADLWRFDFTDEGSFDGIPYQNPFTASLYLNLTFSEPTAPTDDDYWTNGVGERFLNYANTQDQVTALAIDMPDDLLGPFKAASKAATITATRLLTGIEYPVNDLQIQYSKQADSVFSSATLTWVRNYYHADAFNDRRSFS